MIGEGNPKMGEGRKSETGFLGLKDGQDKRQRKSRRGRREKEKNDRHTFAFTLRNSVLLRVLCVIAVSQRYKEIQRDTKRIQNVAQRSNPQQSKTTITRNL